MNEDRLDINIRQARRINRAILVVVLVIVALLVGFNWPRPADAAEPTTRYDVGENPRDIGDWPAGPIFIDATWAHKRWKIDKAVAHLRTETGLDIRVTRGNRNDLPNFMPCQRVEAQLGSCVTVSSDRSPYTGPTGKRLGEVSLWSTGGVLDAADVSLDDKDGKRAGKRKRAAKLESYLRQAVGR